MKILVIGSGGREHAIAWRLKMDDASHRISCCPGNAGIAEVAQCIPAGAARVQDYLDAALSVKPDLTVVGPEAPLVGGLIDLLRRKHLPAVGPTAAAAQLEGSKIFAKQFMERNGIPTARFITCASADEAIRALDSFRFPVVVKADGLAGGKGVVIASDRAHAEESITLLGSAAYVIEEFLDGEEVSFIAISDGTTVLPLAPSQDHKRVHDNDEGPNTGGMGAYSDSRILTDHEATAIMTTIIQPAINGMAAEGQRFTGFLYAGLMLTANGPQVLEFNTRLGDPETQALMHRIESGWTDTLARAAEGSLSSARLRWKPTPSVCVVLAAHNYPATPRTGDSITGIQEAEERGAVVFHSGTKATADALLTAGGRVLGVTHSGSTLQQAVDNTYHAVRTIHFDGMHYRTDIGRKGLRRYNESNPGT